MLLPSFVSETDKPLSELLLANKSFVMDICCWKFYPNLYNSQLKTTIYKEKYYIDAQLDYNTNCKYFYPYFTIFIEIL